jgi:hypothetical protein
MPTTTTSAPALFSPEWAEAVRDAVDRGPSDELRAEKLPTYLEWIDEVRAGYDDSWALVDPDLPAEFGGGPAHLLLQWERGRCTRAAIVGPEEAAGATYVLRATHEAWRELLDGADAGRMLIYRRVRLERGDVLQFFRGVYFVVEALAALGRVPARLDEVGRLTDDRQAYQ